MDNLIDNNIEVVHEGKDESNKNSKNSQSHATGNNDGSSRNGSSPL